MLQEICLVHMQNIHIEFVIQKICVHLLAAATGYMHEFLQRVGSLVRELLAKNGMDLYSVHQLSVSLFVPSFLTCHYNGSTILAQN